jgi:hypothetical protein
MPVYVAQGGREVKSLAGSTVYQSTFGAMTPSTSYIVSNDSRRVLTIYNDGPGDLYVSPGSIVSTTVYQVIIGPGQYWEAPEAQVTLDHCALYSTACVARLTAINL